MKGKFLRRAWSVYCSDGQLWECGLRKEEATMERALADSECMDCEGEHSVVLETEKTDEVEAKVA